MHSIGTARELRRFLDRFGAERLDGVSVHERLLEPASVASLRSIAEVLMTWPVNRPGRARELVRLGVDGRSPDDAAALSVRALVTLAGTPPAWAVVTVAFERVQALDGRFLAGALAPARGACVPPLALRNVLAAAYPARRVPTASVACVRGGVALNGFLPARGGEAAKVAS